MALITTIGGNRSNSFITVDDADALLAEHTIVDTSAWSSLTEAQKIERLLYAGLILKNRYVWHHWPVYKNQAMPYPRWYLDEDGDHVYVGGGDGPTIPENIKRAQALIALNVVHRGSVGLSPPQDGAIKPGMKRLSLFGSLDITLSDSEKSVPDGSALTHLIHSSQWMIDELLHDYRSIIRFALEDSDYAPELLDEVDS